MLHVRLKMAAEKKLEALSNRLLELDSAIEKQNNSKFREASDSEIYKFVESMKNQNTQIKTNSNLKKIYSWRAAKSRKYPLKRIGPVSSPILPECQEKMTGNTNQTHWRPTRQVYIGIWLINSIQRKHLEGRCLQAQQDCPHVKKKIIHITRSGQDYVCRSLH